jgi:hypothetical protein
MPFLKLNIGKLQDDKKKSIVISIGNHIYLLDKTLSVLNWTGQKLFRIKHICPVENFRTTTFIQWTEVVHWIDDLSTVLNNRAQIFHLLFVLLDTRCFILLYFFRFILFFR